VLSLGPTYHGREIRACVWVVPRVIIPAHLAILVTGSEDGLVREAYIDIASNAVTRTAVLAQTMGRSAVRAMCVTQHPDGVGTILVAACSRLVLMCWHITWIEDGTRTRAHLLAQRGLPSTPHSARGGAYADDADDADARYLCVTAWTHGDHCVYVACGSSDAQLSIWALTTTGQNCTWKLVDTAHCSRMQLSVARLLQRSGEMLLAFGGTDGDVTIWACSDGADDQEVNPAGRLRRMAALQQVHQSGVNALRACCGSSAEGSPCTWIITGGDDGAVCVLGVVFTPPMGLRVIAAVRCPASHSSSVKSVVLHDGTTFAAVSMDQRVCLWCVRFATWQSPHELTHS
jgi:WD40 repeat protein